MGKKWRFLRKAKQEMLHTKAVRKSDGTVERRRVTPRRDVGRSPARKKKQT